jgi:hypothetical protein
VTAGSIIEVASSVKGISEYYNGRTSEFLGFGVPSREEK